MSMGSRSIVRHFDMFEFFCSCMFTCFKYITTNLLFVQAAKKEFDGCIIKAISPTTHNRNQAIRRKRGYSNKRICQQTF